MDEDSVFTKRFVESVKKPHEERTDQDIEYICHTLKKVSEFRSYDNASLSSVPERLVYLHCSTDSILFSRGDKVVGWYYVLRGGVMISMNYFYYNGSSFGQCLTSDVREDQCHVLEESEILMINYTEDELKLFRQRAAKQATRSQSTNSSGSLERSGNKTNSVRELFRNIERSGSDSKTEKSREELVRSGNQTQSNSSNPGSWAQTQIQGNRQELTQSGNQTRAESSQQKLTESGNQTRAESSQQELTESGNQTRAESSQQELTESGNQTRAESSQQELTESGNQTRAESSQQELVESQAGDREAIVDDSTPVQHRKAENGTTAMCSKEVASNRTSPESLSISDRHATADLDLIDPLTPVESGHTPNHLEAPERDRRSRSEERYFSFDSSDMKKLSMSNDSLNKAMEDPINPCDDDEPTMSEVSVRTGRSRDRERRYSAPPGPDRRIRDSVGSMEYLSESQADSDDEESVQSETSCSTSMDAVHEVLSKPPVERTEEDIERVMDVLQYMPVFSNMTSNIRRALFHILMLWTVDNENTIIIDNGEEVDKWYVVLNGQLKLLRDTEGDKTYHVGDNFGVTASLKILPHRGKLITATRDCTLCYVSASDYGHILTQGEENMLREEEGGKLVAMLEKRAVDVRREGYFIVQATPERLLEHLLEESVDDTFHKDFLLTYRTFLKSPAPIVKKLKWAWHHGLPEQREKITMIVLNWVTEHFPDFEGNTEMTGFLDWFEERLIEDGKVGEKRALDKARSVHARVRSIEMDRAGTKSPLDFNVVGGWEVAHPVFVSKVEPASIPDRAGLRVGDQILEINDAKCEKKELREVLSILRKNFKLSLKVRSNLPEFKQFMADPPKPPPDYDRKTKSPAPMPVVAHIPISRCNSESKPDGAAPGRRMRSFSQLTKAPGSPKLKKRSIPKIFKPLTGLGKTQLERLKKLRIRTHSNSFIGSDSADSGSRPVKAKGKMPTRKMSTENILEDLGPKQTGPIRASSMEDISTYSTRSSGSTAAPRVVDAVVKLYQPDHTYKYIDISPTTTITDLIHRGVKEFYPDKFVVSPPDEYCICMVTVQSRNGPIRNSVLPNHMTDLDNFIGLESRYYLKERAFHGTLVQDEEAEQIFKESRQWELILNLSPKQVAEELTRQDSEVFCSIDASEYIADLWRNPDHLTKENLAKFENIPNDEMYWVVTTIVSETRADSRAKFIKHFVKIAKWCRELKNFNTMFHILSGLNHGLVQRLRSTWERVPHKHKRALEDLTGFMNPFHNMAKYRELQRSTPPPIIPFFPIIKKDLTFLYDGNESQVEGLVNFEKLRMLSRQIRVVKTYCQQTIMPDPPEVDLGQLGVLKSIHHSIRLRGRSPTTLAALTDNALKKVYHHHRMTKMVRKHLARKYVVQEEDLLEKIADSSERMVQLRKNPPSPIRGKRAATKEKHKSASLSISPSPTTGSFGSDTSAPVTDSLATPPLSPKKLVAPGVSGLVSGSTSGSSTPPRSPSFNNSFGNANGSAQYPK